MAIRPMGQINHLTIYPCTVSSEILSLRKTQDLMWQFENKNSEIIFSNSDMKSGAYTKTGVYICSSNIAAQSLQNCPIDKAFVLFVYKSAKYDDPYIMQEFRSIDGEVIYKRYYVVTAGTWSDVYEYKDTTFIKFHRFDKQTTPVSDILAYAETILAGYGFDMTYIVVGNLTGVSGFSGYSGGIITHCNDTVMITFFYYNTGLIYTNARSRSADWTGWKKFTGVSI